MEEDKVKNSPFICNKTDRVMDVWKQLIQRGHLSAPVLDDFNNFIGFIDMGDIVFNFIEKIKDKDSYIDYLELLENDEKFKSLKVVDILDKKRNPSIVLGRNHTLYFILEVFAKDFNIHRIPITDNNNILVNLITQREIISYIYNNIPYIGTITKKHLGNCKNVNKSVISVSEDDEAIKGFDLMLKNQVGGVTVVNSSGEIVGALSLTDLKIVSRDNKLFEKLYNKTSEFLVALDQTYSERPYLVKTVSMKDNLEDVINKLHIWKLHRIFVVDKDKKPVGVVGLKEILNEILYN